jgi:hypothetical protein
VNGLALDLHQIGRGPGTMNLGKMGETMPMMAGMKDMPGCMMMQPQK